MADTVHATQADPAWANVVQAVGWTGYAVVLFGLLSIYRALLYVLRVLYWPISWVLLPFTYLGRLFLAGLALPFRFIILYQDFFVYFSIAAVLGLFGGLVIHLIYQWLRSTLRLDAVQEHRGRTLKQFREDRRKAKLEPESSLLAAGHLPSTVPIPGYVSLSDSTRRSRRQKGVTAQTILEEEDSDF